MSDGWKAPKTDEDVWRWFADKHGDDVWTCAIDRKWRTIGKLIENGSRIRDGALGR